MAAEDLTLRMRAAGARQTSRDVDRVAGSTGKLRKEAEGTRKGFLRARAGLGVFSGGLRGSLGVFSGAASALGVLGVGGAATMMVQSFRESRKVTAQTAAAIESIGASSWTSADAVGQLAGAISTKTGVDDEMIQSGQNVLLTFKQIRNEAGANNDIFDRATMAMVDMSKAGNGAFGDISSASKMLGKALNDPLKGMTALGRAGVTFTDSQREQVKAMVENNDLLGAQRIILGEVEAQVRGSAEAQADPIDKMTVAWGNLMELLGGYLWPTVTEGIDIFTGFVVGIQEGTGAGGDFRDAVMDVAGALQDAYHWTRENGSTLLILGSAVLGATAAYRGFLIIQRVVAFMSMLKALYIGARAGVLGLTAAQYGLNLAMRLNPIGMVITVLGLLVGAGIAAYKTSDTFRKKVDSLWDTLKNAPGNIWEGLKGGLEGTLNWIIDRINNFIDGINALPGPDIGLVANVGGVTNGPAPTGNAAALFRGAGPRMARGGRVERSGMFELGDRGREDVYLPAGSVVRPQIGPDAARGGDTYIAATFVTPDGEVTARQVVKASRKRRATR